jgi:hypothetical protein
MAGHHPNRPRHGHGAPGTRGGALARPLDRTSPKGAQIRDSGLDLDDEQTWFQEPWRDGRNAVRLLETLGILAGGSSLPDPIQGALARAPADTSAADYTAVEAAGLEAGLRPGVDGVVIPAAAGCLCNWIANSHGGGHVPNVYLRGTVGWLMWRGLSPDSVRWEAGRARARDWELADGPSADFARLWFSRRYVAAWRLVAR